MFRYAAMALALVSVAAAQTRPAWDRVFSTSQADRGRASYGANCARCHGPDLGGGESTPALAGSTFLGRWRDKAALDLLDRTRRTMPTDNPGGLGSRQYADAVAYVLSVNGFRPGDSDLAAAGPAPARGMTEWRFYGSDAA